MFCYKCGKKLSKNDKYCMECGAKVLAPQKADGVQDKSNGTKPKSNNPQVVTVRRQTQQATPPKNQNPKVAPPKTQAQQNVSPKQQPVMLPEQQAQQTVLPNNKPKQSNPSKKQKTKAESFMKFMTLMFGIFALIIITIVGSMLVSGHLAKNSDVADDTSSVSVSRNTMPSNTTTYPDSTMGTTSTSTKQTMKDGAVILGKDELAQKILGTWKTKITYKSMEIPCTMVFNSNGKCTVTMKALFITKKFQGTYTVGDNGRCEIKLPGIEEFMSKNTIAGQAAFYNDDKAKFVTDDRDVLTLKRA